MSRAAILTERLAALHLYDYLAADFKDRGGVELISIPVHVNLAKEKRKGGRSRTI